MRKIIVLLLAVLIIFSIGFGLLAQNMDNQQPLVQSYYDSQNIRAKQAFSKTVMYVTIDGEITRSTELMVQDALFKGFYAQADLIVFFINTPGGELSAVHNIMNMFEASGVPICVFVAPLGSTAWSGGTYLLMSSHISAMSIGTIMGSAQPVQTGQLVYNLGYVSAMVSLMTAHARLHDRNVTIAQQFVTINLNLLPDTAKKSGMIDIVANDLFGLLQQLENKTLIKYNSSSGVLAWKLVETADVDDYPGRVSEIDFAGISDSPFLYYYDRPIQYNALNIIVNPYVTYILLIVGLFAIIIGLKTPGFGAEIIGIICLILGLAGLGVLGFNLASILFFVTGSVLFLLELKTQTFALAAGGIACFILGALLIFPTSNWLITYNFIQTVIISVVVVSLFISGFFAYLVYKVGETRKIAKELDIEELVGKTGKTKTDLTPKGQVLVESEIWSAKSHDNKLIREGTKIKVIEVKGLTLIVEPVKSKAKEL
ncbi:MAG: NfeD family protein [Candidatus Jordarchaeum sp.]|uniref:NfeD family protein n=1 Tax=Candidatus Jordarchaeum sp. TaxID=2823881 RepID=UPI00404A71A2